MIMIKKYTWVNVVFSLYFCGIVFSLTDFEKSFIYSLISFVILITNIVVRKWIMSLILAIICFLYSSYMTLVVFYISFVQSYTITTDSMKILHIGLPIGIVSILISALMAVSALYHMRNKKRTKTCQIS